MAKQKITDIKRLQQANIYTTKIFMEFEMIVFHVFGSVYLQLIYPWGKSYSFHSAYK